MINKEDIAGLVLDWVVKNEELGILKIVKGDLDIAVLAATIARQGNK